MRIRFAVVLGALLLTCPASAQTRPAGAPLLAAVGASSGKTAIPYCQIGLRSSLLYFAARYAGLDAINYVGSWSDWSARGLPKESAR